MGRPTAIRAAQIAHILVARNDLSEGQGLAPKPILRARNALNVLGAASARRHCANLRRLVGPSPTGLEAEHDRIKVVAQRDIVLSAGGLKRAVDATDTRNNGRVADVRKYDKASANDGAARTNR